MYQATVHVHEAVREWKDLDLIGKLGLSTSSELHKAEVN